LQAKEKALFRSPCVESDLDERSAVAAARTRDKAVAPGNGAAKPNAPRCVTSGRTLRLPPQLIEQGRRAAPSDLQSDSRQRASDPRQLDDQRCNGPADMACLAARDSVSADASLPTESGCLDLIDNLGVAAELA
jgi:hypothetical protein